MAPIYEFEHPSTGELFEELRPFKDSDKVFIAPDGVECKRVISRNIDGYKKNRECFEVDPGYVKHIRPKYIRFNDGHKEKFDPQKHC